VGAVRQYLSEKADWAQGVPRQRGEVSGGIKKKGESGKAIETELSIKDISKVESRRTLKRSAGEQGSG